MGTNPAVYIASIYLYMFELEFVQRLGAAARRLPAGADLCERRTAEHALAFFTDPAGHAAARPYRYAALHILRSCQSDQRFVDDLITIGNPYLGWLRYEDAT